MRTLVLGCLLLAGPALAGPRVVVSVLPLAGVVDAVSCGEAQVHVLVPPGANPATWVPTLRDREAVQAADFVVRVGHPVLTFERRWLGDLVADRDDIGQVEAASGLPLLDEDPHVWTSPVVLERMASNLGAALAPGGGADCLEAYLAAVAKTRAEIVNRMASLAGKRFYVFHPAWGYFARDFGLSQVAIERHGKEPGPAHLARLIDQARADRARVILVQPQFSDAAATVVADAIGAEVMEADPLARDMLSSLHSLAEILAHALADMPADTLDEDAS